jgi:pilus assembly protein FimV
MDFDLNLDLGSPKTEAPKAAEAPLDLGGLSLDLGQPAGDAGPSGADPKWQEVATKLDLAKAYQEMGDKDGARELLNEVVKEGDSAQKSQAQQMLSSLG